MEERDSGGIGAMNVPDMVWEELVTFGVGMLLGEGESVGYVGFFGAKEVVSEAGEGSNGGRGGFF